MIRSNLNMEYPHERGSIVMFRDETLYVRHRIRLYNNYPHDDVISRETIIEINKHDVIFIIDIFNISNSSENYLDRFYVRVYIPSNGSSGWMYDDLNTETGGPYLVSI
jgi:hypothetical protein